MRQIKAIVLAGGRDFGRCPIASRVSPALWPVFDKSVLERLLHNLSEQGVKQAVICSNGDTALLQNDIKDVDFMQVDFCEDELPMGSAGCIRDAANGDTDTLFIVLNAATILPPDIGELVRAHHDGKCEMTVVFEPCPDNDVLTSRLSGIYICEPSIVEHIPKQGYCDIKEGLIPILNRAGKNICTVVLDKPVGSFRNRAGYLAAIAHYLENHSDLPLRKLRDCENVWCADNVTIPPDAKIFGPAVILDGSVVSEGAIIFGPAVIGRNVKIGESSFLENCVLWDGSIVGKRCCLRNSLADYNTVIPTGQTIEDRVIASRQFSRFKGLIGSAVQVTDDKIDQLRTWTELLAERFGAKTALWTAVSVITLVFIWSYWFNFVELWEIWRQSDEYSSGMLVPFFAVYVLRTRRDEIFQHGIQPSVWGLLGFIFAQAVRYFGLYFMYSSAERFSIVLTIASLALLIFGWSTLRKLVPLLLFLCLMLPLPRSLHTAVMLPLQNVATKSAVVCLETAGYSVFQEGNIINLNGTTIAVAEACNGLRMITAFFVVTGFVVLMLRRPWWEKLMLLASSLPVALLCNTVRLTVTSIAFTRFHAGRWEQMFHDLGGYAMMPLAIAIVMFELWLLAKLTVSYSHPQCQ